MTLQERLGAFEAEAKGRIRRALSTGNSKLMELDGALAKVSGDDWTVPAMRKHLDELKARADTLRASAVKRVQAIPAEAVGKIVSGTRTPVQNLARGLADMAKKFEAPGPKAVRTEKAEKGEAKVAKTAS